MINNLKVALDAHAFLPERAHDTDAGLDLRSREFAHIPPLTTVKISTGVHIELPKDYEASVRPRSSMSLKGILVHYGTVDAGYTGDIGIVVTNLNPVPYIIDAGDKIAQLVITPIELPEAVQVDIQDLGQSERGDKGFGSSGV